VSIKVKAKSAAFKDPKWSKTPANPGDEVELSVTGERLADSDEVWFVVFKKAAREAGPLGALKADKDGTTYKKKWVAPNTYADVELEFDAEVRVKPAPANGHRTILHKVKSGAMVVQGFQVTITSLDAAFIPKRTDEKLELKHAIVDPHGAAKKGRYEVWAEKYPGDPATDPPKPLYTKDFTPAAGATTWHEWVGLANAGVLNNKHLTPEFSPYRLRVVIGPDQEAVDDPHGKGLGKVAMAEKQFEVAFESLHLRIQDGLVETTANDVYGLSGALVVEGTPGGPYAARGRLPVKGEHARLRLPMVSHSIIGQELDQGGLEVGNDYMDPSGVLKHTQVDRGKYTRPQLPVEVELRMRSRDSSINTDADKKGVFEAKAVGPLRIEPWVEDFYDASLYSGTGIHNVYRRNATHKVKRGAHNAPTHGSTDAPIFGYWQTRLVATANQESFDVRSVDTTNTFEVGRDELVVFLNRARLTLGDKADYTEEDDHTIKLRKGLAKADDVLWVIRSDSRASGGDVVANFGRYPHGTNCHEHYGGIRGAAVNNLLFGDYQAVTTTQTLIGASTNDFPFKDAELSDKEPDPVDADKQERVMIWALEKDAKEGLAGFIFSPSTIAGDSYVLHGRVDAEPYARRFGWTSAKPLIDAASGDITVWRRMTIAGSWRMPDRNTVGLTGGKGSTVEAALHTRTYFGDGRNLEVSSMNRDLLKAYNEWEMSPPVAIEGASQEWPILITAPSHGVSDWAVVNISGVTGNVAANGSFVAEVVDGDSFRLWGKYLPDLSTLDEAVDGTSSGAYTPKVITGATNASPIEITATAHGLSDGARVTIRGVGGNTAANGYFRVTRTGGSTFTLDGSDGRKSGTFAGTGGRIYTGHIDVHAGLGLTTYQAQHDGYTGFGAGRVPIDALSKIQNHAVVWDHYRNFLPPGLNVSQRNAARYAIANEIPVGTVSGTARATMLNRVSAGIPGTATVPTTPPVYTAGDSNAYFFWCLGIFNDAVNAVLDGIMGQPNPAPKMNVLRWPQHHDTPLWTGPGVAGMVSEGFCRGSGQAFFRTAQVSTTLFTHEMGHSAHLVHFVAVNFGWKHHDLRYPQCLMSYTFPEGYIPKPSTGVAPDVGTPDTAWPDTVPSPRPTGVAIAASASVGDRTIHYGPLGNVLNGFCAKCELKLRGWKEEQLPCAWMHPDLF
jgi:hypothetical protein